MTAIHHVFSLFIDVFAGMQYLKNDRNSIENVMCFICHAPLGLLLLFEIQLKIVPEIVITIDKMAVNLSIFKTEYVLVRVVASRRKVFFSQSLALNCFLTFLLNVF